MKIVSDKYEMIFRKDYNGKPTYSVGLSKKKQDGTYENGYLKVSFKNGIELQDKTKIKIKDAWLNFNVVEKKTYPFIFIKEFEIEEKKEENPFEDFGNSIKTEADNSIEINSEDLPF